MQYRKFGKVDWFASVLGFGCMRLPVIDGKPNGAHINEAEALRMIRHAMERGVNYFDTAYVYHEGSSETVLGKALSGHRDEVKIATKFSSRGRRGPMFVLPATNAKIVVPRRSRSVTGCRKLTACSAPRKDGGKPQL
jgi:aryl-alcohol dehydrogenase-like predicted oxidoreductase